MSNLFKYTADGQSCWLDDPEAPWDIDTEDMGLSDLHAVLDYLELQYVRTPDHEDAKGQLCQAITHVEDQIKELESGDTQIFNH